MSTIEAVDEFLGIEQEPAEARPGRLRRVVRGVGSGLDWVFGVVSLVLGLAFLAALPLTQFLCLGYFLESSARVARTGKWRDGLIGVRRAARAGGIAVGMGLSLLPVWLARIYVRSAALVDPGGRAELAWRVALGVVSVVVFGHVVAACAKGGRLRHFLWPVGSLLWWVRLPRRPGTYARIRDGFWEFLRGFRFPHYFRVGGVGFGGTLVWLAPPAFLISRSGPAPLLGVLGVLWLGIVVPFLPFLQVRYAVEGNWRALFQVRGVKDRFKRAPWAFAVALMALLLAAIPLYLLKIETIPREASWLPALVFVVFLMPARILTGWAYARAIRREKPRHWFFRVLGRVAIVPAAVLYVLIVFFAQYTSWGGSWSLYEQHAFLLPVPFLHQ